MGPEARASALLRRELPSDPVPDKLFSPNETSSVVSEPLNSPLPWSGSFASDSSSSSKKRTGMLLHFFSFPSGAMVSRNFRFIEEQLPGPDKRSMGSCVLRQRTLDQSRHVVYHSHHTRIFDSHGAYDTESSGSLTFSDPVRRSNQSTVSH